MLKEMQEGGVAAREGELEKYEIVESGSAGECEEGA